MAQGIAHEIIDLHHISLVPAPADKRCVAMLDEASEEFKVVRHLAKLISSGAFQIQDFAKIEISKRRSLDPAYEHLRAEDPCCCGSRVRFIDCCAAKAYVEHGHIDVIATPTKIEDVAFR